MDLTAVASIVVLALIAGVGLGSWMGFNAGFSAGYDAAVVDSLEPIRKP